MVFVELGVFVAVVFDVDGGSAFEFGLGLGFEAFGLGVEHFGAFFGVGFEFLVGRDVDEIQVRAG